MTNVKIYSGDERIKLKVEGHSEYASDGPDIVCSGISTIAYAFAELCCELSAENKVLVNTVKMVGGLLELDVTDRYGILQYPLQMLSIGLNGISDQYPKNLSVEWGEINF